MALHDGEIRSLIEQVVTEVLDRTTADRPQLNGRLGFTESEAAALIGVRPHVLRDCRRRGEIAGKLVGKRIIYTRDALEGFLSDRERMRE